MVIVGRRRRGWRRRRFSAAAASECHGGGHRREENLVGVRIGVVVEVGAGAAVSDYSPIEVLNQFTDVVEARQLAARLDHLKSFFCETQSILCQKKREFWILFV